jgi:hypothetical protein
VLKEVNREVAPAIRTVHSGNAFWARDKNEKYLCW